MKTANFEVREVWTVDCPECGIEQDAEFNQDNPGHPKPVYCPHCGERFILTYERD